MYSKKDISAQNTFTDPIKIIGEFNVSISGTWAGKVTLLRSINGGAWEEVNSWTQNFSGWDKEPEIVLGIDVVPTQYKLGFKAGDYISGTATCTVGNG